MTDVVAVGAQIRATRKEHHLTQAELAALAGISERTIRGLERGEGNPSFDAVASTAAVLGLKIALTP